MYSHDTMGVGHMRRNLLIAQTLRRALPGANVLMIANEHGSKIALRMAAFIFPFAFLVGGTVNQIGKWLLAT